VGVRPEFIRFASEGLPVRIERIADVGRFRIVDARHGDQIIKVLVGEGEEVPRESGHVSFDPRRTQVYADGWIVE
jgi:glycerol transport system ATP-binding protein